MFPYYLSIGCTYEEYWNGSPWIAASYREAEMFRFEQKNYEMWLQGLYVHDAVSAAIGLAFWNKKGMKPKYSDRQYAITQREKDEEKRRKTEAARKFFEDGQKK